MIEKIIGCALEGIENHKVEVEVNIFRGEETLSFLRNASKSLKISARSFNRIKKIARTIADLDSCKNIIVDHIAEAIQYRSLEKLKQFLN